MATLPSHTPLQDGSPPPVSTEAVQSGGDKEFGPIPFGAPKLPDVRLKVSTGEEACLTIGMSITEAEERLVGRGLAPAIAATVVNEVLERGIHERSAFLSQSERSKHVHWFLSSIMAGVCLFVAYLYGGGASVGITALYLLLPIACVWFPPQYTDRGGLSTWRALQLRWSGWVLLGAILSYRAMLLLAAGQDN
jgi:hypothetical protein